MDTAVRDSLIAGYEALTAFLELPDTDDRHVLVTAIMGRREIVTQKSA